MATSIRKQKHEQIQNLVLAAMFTAIVIVLQFIGAAIRFGPFSVSLVLIPIAVGAAVCGPYVGAWLGLVFGAVVILSGITTGDIVWFMEYSAVGTVITVLLKGIFAGLGAGLVYKALKNVNKWLAGIAAAIICPILNTGIFFCGCLVFFGGLFQSSEGFSGSVPMYVITAVIGFNFVFELLLNTVMSPVIVRLIDLALHRRKS